MFTEKKNSHDRNKAHDSTIYNSSTIENRFSIPQVSVEEDYDQDFDDDFMDKNSLNSDQMNPVDDFIPHIASKRSSNGNNLNLSPSGHLLP